jgi:hypothetical protein
MENMTLLLVGDVHLCFSLCFYVFIDAASRRRGVSHVSNVDADGKYDTLLVGDVHSCFNCVVISSLLPLAFAKCYRCLI